MSFSEEGQPSTDETRFYCELTKGLMEQEIRDAVFNTRLYPCAARATEIVHIDGEPVHLTHVRIASPQ